MDLVNGYISQFKTKDYLRSKTGLPINTYFSANKYKWMIENISDIKERIVNGNKENLCFGTIDSWVNYVD
jgi:glycerol kinase